MMSTVGETARYRTGSLTVVACEDCPVSHYPSSVREGAYATALLIDIRIDAHGHHGVLMVNESQLETLKVNKCGWQLG